jgi:mRNA deadenylase 3'-5' endonuclease subunit Ccr4
VKDTKPKKDKKPKMSGAIQSLEQRIMAKELKLSMLDNSGLPIEEVVKIIESNEPLQSAYSNYTKLDPTYLEPKYGYEPIYTNFTPTFKGTLDYLFYRGSSKHQIEVESILSLPDRETLGDGLPNLEYGSDHLSIAAKFIFK